MKIRTNADEQTIRNAAKLARVRFDRFKVTGSRTHARTFDVTLFGESSRLPNGGRSGGYVYGQDNDHAATWDQWGVFLNAIFDADPTSRMTYYRDAADYHWQTAARFAEGWPVDAHGDHRWEASGHPYRTEAGTVYTQSCKRCSASKRFVYQPSH